MAPWLAMAAAFSLLALAGGSGAAESGTPAESGAAESGTPAESGAAALFHATQKILATELPLALAEPFHLAAARNEYEPLLVVITGLQTVSSVRCNIAPGGGPVLPTAVYRVGYVSVVNITVRF